jgi:hypothetical protein
MCVRHAHPSIQTNSRNFPAARTDTTQQFSEIGESLSGEIPCVSRAGQGRPGAAAFFACPPAPLSDVSLSNSNHARLAAGVALPGHMCRTHYSRVLRGTRTLHLHTGARHWRPRSEGPDLTFGNSCISSSRCTGQAIIRSQGAKCCSGEVAVVLWYSIQI